MKYLLLVFLFIFCNLSWARPIEVGVRDYGWLTSFPALKDVLDFYVQDIENDLNNEQPILDPARFNRGTANSSVLASKGLGTDYVNNPEKFTVSLGLGIGIDDEKNKAIRDEISGAASASSVTIGTRMDQFTNQTKILGLETNKLMAFINYGTFNYSDDIPTKDFDIAGDLKSTNFGFHFRYDLVEMKGNEWLGWGGLKLHFGYEYNKNKVELATTLDKPLEVDTGVPGTLTGRLTGTPTYEVETETHSIPLELSTSFLFLKVFSLYGGTGMDLNYGESVGKGNINGDISTLACTSGICAGETVLPQLEAQANYDAKSQVRDVTFRGFAGLQVDLPFRLHAFGQYSQVFGTELKAVSTGLKYSF